MKKMHIAILVLIAAAIAVLVSFTGNLTTYETVASAQQKRGKFVRLIAKVDNTQPVEYNAAKDPNYMSFTAVDTLGNKTKVIFHNSKPADFEKSERLVLNGRMENGHFECKDMLMKCPSKYKDDPNVMKKNITITY
jgi:cytochrome c-type biogenesis protein CcmE